MEANKAPRVQPVDNLGNLLGSVDTPWYEANSAFIRTALERQTFHDNHLYVAGYLDIIGHGLNPEATVEFAIGKATAIGTGAYTLIESHPFVQPSGNNQLYLQSTNAQDAAGGSGVEAINVEYFPDEWGARQTVEVIPEGTNQVTLSVADIHRIHKVYGIDGHAAAGNITITNQAAGIEYGRISQYETFMRRSIFYIAENERVVVTQAIISSTTSGGVNAVLFTSQEDADGGLITRGERMIEVANNTPIIEFRPWVTITNLSNLHKSVGVAGYGNLANQKFTVTLVGFLKKVTAS